MVATTKIFLQWKQQVQLQGIGRKSAKGLGLQKMILWPHGET